MGDGNGSQTGTRGRGNVCSGHGEVGGRSGHDEPAGDRAYLPLRPWLPSSARVTPSRATRCGGPCGRSNFPADVFGQNFPAQLSTTMSSGLAAPRTTAPVSSSSPRRARPTRRVSRSRRHMPPKTSAGPSMWDGSTIPPVITSETPGTWAHDTVSRRLREDILARVFRDNADVLAAGTDAEVNLRALDAELSTTSTSVITHIPPDGGPDLATWSTL